MRLYYNNDIGLEEETDCSYQFDLPAADPLEIRIKEVNLVRERFTPRPYDITPGEIFALDYAEKIIARLKNDNQR
ncbi:hypothetical protein HYV89_03700 [Candidatus Woesearchaeota archaeon]|nr:hypothetical protein [Candidatus Woesearchaeota archaeon]